MGPGQVCLNGFCNGFRGHTVHLQCQVGAGLIGFSPALHQLPDPAQGILTLQQRSCGVPFQAFIDGLGLGAQVHHRAQLPQQRAVAGPHRSSASHRIDALMSCADKIFQQLRLLLPEIRLPPAGKDLRDTAALPALNQFVRVFHRPAQLIGKFQSHRSFAASHKADEYNIIPKSSIFNNYSRQV